MRHAHPGLPQAVTASCFGLKRTRAPWRRGASGRARSTRSWKAAPESICSPRQVQGPPRQAPRRALQHGAAPLAGHTIVVVAGPPLPLPHAPPRFLPPLPTLPPPVPPGRRGPSCLRRSHLASACGRRLCLFQSRRSWAARGTTSPSLPTGEPTARVCVWVGGHTARGAGGRVLSQQVCRGAPAGACRCWGGAAPGS